MTDIFTVIYTSEVEDEVESIPWMLSFADLDLAQAHVREEAAKRLADEESEPTATWTDFEDYSIFIQEYDPDTRDSWTIVRTELVEKAPSGTTSGL